jgi:hypothetical protein
MLNRIDSTKITEANILINLSSLIKQRYQTNVNIIPASRKDDFNNLFLNGPIIIFQFNKPSSSSSNKNNNYTKFIIEIKQHNELMQIFKPGQAFYIFVALTTLSETILDSKRTVVVDIHNIPADNHLIQKFRVIRMAKSSLSPKLQVSQRRKFEAITNIMTLDELSNYFIKRFPGIASLSQLLRFNSFTEVFRSVTQHMYCVIIGTESIAAS